MKFFLISDNVDTKMGMRFAGIDGVVVHTEQEVTRELTKAMEREDVAVILMTETLVSLCPDLIYDLKLNRKKPLIVEIPDRHGNGRTKDSITKYVQDAIGVWKIPQKPITFCKPYKDTPKNKSLLPILKLSF